MAKDLRELPKLRDSISYLYIEHAVIERENSSIIMICEDGKIPVPVSSLTTLLLGTGTSITHAAIRSASESGCMIVWCGEGCGRFYASGLGETRSAGNLLLQAKLCMDPDLHMAVVRRMYEIRFPSLPTKDLTLQQIRGMEGVRVKQAYKTYAKQSGVSWSARKYKQIDWDSSDDINRALSIANAILYSVCQAAIVSLGFSTGLGFIHTGKQLSFVYDIADLYKTETSVPAAFEAVHNNKGDLDKIVRLYVRQNISKTGILQRIANDIAWVFSVPLQEEHMETPEAGAIWDIDQDLPGGINYDGSV